MDMHENEALLNLKKKKKVCLLLPNCQSNTVIKVFDWQFLVLQISLKHSQSPVYLFICCTLGQKQFDVIITSCAVTDSRASL